jgi:hypothetical protein
MLTASGLQPRVEATVLGEVAFPTVEALVHTEIQASPLAGRTDDAAYVSIAHDARTDLDEFIDARGGVTLPIRAVFVAARSLSA